MDLGLPSLELLEGSSGSNWTVALEIDRRIERIAWDCRTFIARVARERACKFAEPTSSESRETSQIDHIFGDVSLVLDDDWEGQKRNNQMAR